MKTALMIETFKDDERELKLVGTVDDQAIIGTSEKAHLRLDDWRCSGIHALIKKEGNSFKVIDLGSNYGTYHEERPFSEKVFKYDELFKIGDLNLLFKQLPSSNDYETHEYNKQSPDYENQVMLSSEKTVLEVSLFWGEKILEIAQFKQGSKISIGNPRIATFGVPEELLPDESLKEGKFELAEYEKGSLKLHVPKLANGLVWNGGKVLNLDTLRLYGSEEVKNADQMDVALRLGDKAHVEFGELIITFRFINPAKKIKTSLLPKWDKQLSKIIAGIFAFYLLIVLILSISEPEQKEKTVKDIPKRLKKVVYDIGIKQAKEKRQSAIGNIARTLEGGRARAEEGKSSAKKSKKKKSKQKSKAKKPTNKAQSNEAKSKVVAQTTEKIKKVEMVNLDNAFSDAAPSQTSATEAVLSNVKANGTSASAIADGGFARGNKGLGSGGGGSSVGVGALKGSGMGGGMGAGDYGLAPSKGTEIRLPEEEEIEIMGGLDPDVIAKIIKRYLPQIQYCYEQQLVSKPYLKGKVAVSFIITGQGTVSKEKVIETTLKDTPTESCILSKVKNWKFPKPKGGGTVGVSYPFILMSNNGK
jgi:pSer/pThr/pTyr-binding forkhead associated (FHA) protein